MDDLKLNAVVLTGKYAVTVPVLAGVGTLAIGLGAAFGVKKVISKVKSEIKEEA